MRICVYCASSQQADPIYRQAAFELGELIAQAGHTLVFGGGSAGSMGAVADGALSKGGEVIGIMPHFMDELEWGHRGITQLQLVDSMRERKHRLLTNSDAVVALPGGVGTFEELFEAISLKRLGLYVNPIILLDTKNFYAPLDAFMDQVIAEHFMNPEHASMWQRVAEPADVLPAIADAPAWSAQAREHAVARG
ncbi:MAG TPA: TIGR00730 family Rossman fold protein [Rhodanobacteraceae bacterium]